MWNMQYNTRLCAKNSQYFWGWTSTAPPQTTPTEEGETPSPDPTLFGSYGGSIFAPPALMLGTFGLHRTLAHGKSQLGDIEPSCSFEIGRIYTPG